MPDPQDWLEAHNNAPAITCRELLLRAGYEPLPPREVDDTQLRGRLLELIYALAARRIFLKATNHLSDRELYHWLHEVCLERKMPEVSPESWTCNLCPAGPGGSEDTAIFLRYYADDTERMQWREQGKPLPPREVPPFDRDRFLPAALEAPVETEGLPPYLMNEHDEEPGDPPFDTPETTDPLGLNKVDREIRREQRDIASAEAGAGLFLDSHDDGDRVAKIDQDGWQRPHEELVRSGVVLLPPDELTDETVGPKLWELLHELACRGFYVLNTDHLSDREAYSNLWREDLREPAILPGRSRHGGWFHDFVGSGSEEHTEVWLRYFASDEARARHARDWPKLPLPAREAPRFKRDWRLPKGPF